MAEPQIYKNRNLSIYHKDTVSFKGGSVCSAHVMIKPGVVTPEFDMVGGIGDTEKAAEDDAFRRARALIDYN